MKTLTFVLLLGLTALPAVAGDTPDDLKAQLSAVDKQMRESIRQAVQSAEAVACREAMAAAQKALGEAVAALPAVKEIDPQIEQLKRQLAELQRQRRELAEKSPELAEARQAAEAAQKAYREATVDRADIKAIREKRDRLLQKLAELEETPPAAP